MDKKPLDIEYQKSHDCEVLVRAVDLATANRQKLDLAQNNMLSTFFEILRSDNLLRMEHFRGLLKDYTKKHNADPDSVTGRDNFLDFINILIDELDIRIFGNEIEY